MRQSRIETKFGLRCGVPSDDLLSSLRPSVPNAKRNRHPTRMVSVLRARAADSQGGVRWALSSDSAALDGVALQVDAKGPSRRGVGKR